jgi:hydrogenase maturation protein HypF
MAKSSNKSSPQAPPRTRCGVRIEGAVQGVGFRPYVYRLACEAQVGGHVYNDERGVSIEVEGSQKAIDQFLQRLPAELPPLAQIERLTYCDLQPSGQSGFSIAASKSGGVAKAPVVPDTATCADCVTELFDPADRRYRYPFINCTNCGPRFTIVREIPYDRPFTTMAGFCMCERCLAEYHDPANRRFHAQPNACGSCGPSARLLDASGRPVDTPQGLDAVEACAQALLAGSIVAVKGLGGFHLACRADNETAVEALRARKHREDKPFALMASDLEAAARLVELGACEQALLGSPQRPIVLARRRKDASVASGVAPWVSELGVMLPYSPLHHLLLHDAQTALVMTSGNVSDEPIAFSDEQALQELSNIADLFLMHNRPIHTRTDDSVQRVISRSGAEHTTVLRRSRGYVPQSLSLPGSEPQQLLACGAHLKNTFCLAKDGRAWISHHIGDLANYETLCSFQEGIEHFKGLFAIEPELVACDMHPDYLSTAYAHSRTDLDCVEIQHHHAHLAACLAEHGCTSRAVGAIYDGTGYGSDGSVWGGEFLVGNLEGFERVGCLWPVRMPGGEQAIKQPWRMTCSWLLAAFGSEVAMPTTLVGRVSQKSWEQVAGLVSSGFASPSTTSVGRLFDAVAVLLGLGGEVNYEGQAAVELEAISDRRETGLYPIDRLEQSGLDDRAPASVLDVRATVSAIVRDVAQDADISLIAARFHNTLAIATAQALYELCDRHGIDRVVLSGGVFQNRRLLEQTASLVAHGDLRVLLPARVPCNDGGISFGQAAVAQARSEQVSGT